MNTLNRDAMTIPENRLMAALEERLQKKDAVLAERDRTYGKDRIHIGSYMENLGWPELFGYDMNRFLSDPAFALETELRQRIFWLDNSLDDSKPGDWLGATVGMYYDITLFGQKITHTTIGVPEFAPHPIAAKPDLALIPPIDFYTSGEMPKLIRMYEAMKKLNQERCGGKLYIGFPTFNRGPLDIYIQLRGYENFVEDTMERPQFVHEFLDRIVGERIRWNQERRRYLQEPSPAEPTTYVADDWVNIPFISPAMFREFVMPAYRKIAAAEGKVTGFHTCGILTPVVHDLFAAFPAMQNLDVSGWNDVGELDDMLDRKINFSIAFINSFILCGTPDQHRQVFERIARVGRQRKVFIGANAIVKLYDTYEENIERMNRFIALAREIFRY